MNHDRPFFPMMLRIERKKCIVVGAGKTAASKIKSLSLCGAKVVVVSPKATSAIRQASQSGALVWRRRSFRASDLDGAFLAVAATSSNTVNRAVFRASGRRRILCNVVDDPDQCDFIYPAVARRGPLQIAISTGGCSPALASRLRRDFERQFCRAWGSWVKSLGKQRSDLLIREMPAKMRRRRLEQLASPQAFQEFQRTTSQRPAKK
jgi:siroheme synthase-like protein